MKKIVFITTLLTSILSLGQSTNYTQIDNSTTYKIPFLKVIGQNLSSANINSNVFKDIPIGGETTQNIPDNNIVIDSQVEDFQTKAISPQIGRNFKGNQMHGGTPPDNSMAISNNGFIVSFDNATIEYRNADGDSISWYVDLFTFIDSSTTSQLLFDPKVIYDNEEDRFIAVLVHKDTLIGSSELLVAFSQTNTPSDGWNLYKFNADTLFSDTTWFDRPNIGINNEDLFITGGMFTEVSGDNIGNTTFQITKSYGYSDSTSLICKVWTNILRPDGEIATGMHPMTYGQSGSYGPGIYMVSTNWNGGDSVYTHHILENCSQSPNTVITISHYTDPYELAPLSYQPTNTLLKKTNCRVLDGFFLNNRCHFVFNIIQNGYCAIRYQRINVINNTTVWSSRGYADSQSAYAFPCISSFGNDSLSNDVMISYLRSSPDLNPSIAVLNYDGTNWSGTSIIKEGLDTIDILTNSPLSRERWGDYISMQRRYNAPSPTVWMIGHFGDTLNYWNVHHGWSSWIAEIGDAGVGISENEVSYSNESYIFPNPATNRIFIKDNSKDPIIKFQIFNMNGKLIFEYTELNLNSVTIPSVENGVYIVKLISTKNIIRNEKIIINQ